MVEEKVEVEKKPEYDMNEEEEEGGLSTLFGKWAKEKLKSGKKKRIAEVD